MICFFFLYGDELCRGAYDLHCFLTRTCLNECVCESAVYSKKCYKYTYGTNNAMEVFFMFCRYIVPTRVLVCLCNEMRAIKCSLSGCFKRWLLYGGFFCYYCVLSSVCILKRPFSLHNFRQYTNICARVCLCFFADASCLSFSSHYFCFVFFFCFDYQWEKKNTFVSCDTFTLFSSFLDGKSKNSKRKSSAIFV